MSKKNNKKFVPGMITGTVILDLALLSMLVWGIVALVRYLTG